MEDITHSLEELEATSKEMHKEIRRTRGLLKKVEREFKKREKAIEKGERDGIDRENAARPELTLEFLVPRTIYRKSPIRGRRVIVGYAAISRILLTLVSFNNQYPEAGYAIAKILFELEDDDHVFALDEVPSYGPLFDSFLEHRSLPEDCVVMRDVHPHICDFRERLRLILSMGHHTDGFEERLVDLFENPVPTSVEEEIEEKGLKASASIPFIASKLGKIWWSTVDQLNKNNVDIV